MFRILVKLLSDPFSLVLVTYFSLHDCETTIFFSDFNQVKLLDSELV